MECPFIKRDSVPDPQFNEPKDYRRADGEGGNYRYYIHFDGFDKYYPCQFCQLIGRKRDIFECFNENEWRTCFHYQWESKRRGEALRQQEEPAGAGHKSCRYCGRDDSKDENDWAYSTICPYCVSDMQAWV